MNFTPKKGSNLNWKQRNIKIFYTFIHEKTFLRAAPLLSISFSPPGEPHTAPHPPPAEPLSGQHGAAMPRRPGGCVLLLYVLYRTRSLLFGAADRLNEWF
jgi:hypothetical protein